MLIYSISNNSSNVYSISPMSSDISNNSSRLSSPLLPLLLFLCNSLSFSILPTFHFTSPSTIVRTRFSFLESYSVNKKTRDFTYVKPLVPKAFLLFSMPMVGVEPTRGATPHDFESCASASSATSARQSIFYQIILHLSTLFIH